MLLPKFFELHQRLGKTDPDRAKEVITAQEHIAPHLGFDQFQDFKKAYDRLLEALDLASFDDLHQQFNFNGVMLRASVNVQRLGNHPVDLNAKELESIF